MTITAERLAAFIFTHHILPARERGEGIAMISARQVWKALDGEFPLDLIRGVLGSSRFRKTYHVALIAREGSAEGDPVESFVFNLDPAGTTAAVQRDKRSTDSRSGSPWS